MAKKYEYKIFYWQPALNEIKNLQTSLNKLCGSEGWRVIACVYNGYHFFGRLSVK